MSRGRAAAIALAAVVLSTGPNVAFAQSTCAGALGIASPVQVAVEVRVAHYASGLVLALESCGGLLVPVSPTLSLAGIPVSQDAGTVRGRVPGSNQLIVIDPRRNSVRLGKRRLTVAPFEISETSDGVMVSIDVISKLLGVDVVYDQAGAIVELRGAESLPVAAVARRAAARAARSVVDSTWRDPPPSGTTRRGVALEYDVSLGTRMGSAPWGANRIEASGIAAVATSVVGGVASGRVAVAARTTFDDVAWTRTWPTARLMRELRVGDATTSGARPELVRGIAFSNAPLAMDQIATRLSFGGRLPDGWQVEAVRGANVLDESIARSGAYDLQIPVQRGTTVVDVVATSPAGDQRVFQRSLHTAPMFVAPRQFEYRASLGACSTRIVAAATDRECAGAANVDLRYGLAPGWTVRGGVDLKTGLAAGDMAQPYAGLGGVIARALIVEGTYAPNVGSIGATAAAAARFEPSPLLSIGADYSGSEVVARAVVRDSSGPLPEERPLTFEYARGTRRSAWLRYVPPVWSRRLAIDASTSAYTLESIESVSQRIALPLQLPLVQLMPFWRQDATGSVGLLKTHSALGTDILVVPSGRVTQLLGATWFRGSVERGTVRDAWSASIAHSMRGVRIDVGARGGGIRRGTALTLAIVPQLSRLQAVTLMATDPGGGNARTIQRLNGSAIYDAGGRVQLSSEPALLRGGVAGVAFVDTNGNGRRDAGESAIPGARVDIGNRQIVTDSSGRFATWGFAAHSIVDVRLDTLSLASPWWVPASNGVFARVPNAQLAMIDLPVVVAGSVRGRVELVSDDGSASMLQVPLRLTHVASGAVFDVDTFSDGEFYRDGLRPGEYRLTVDETFLKKAGLGADAVSLTLTSLGDAGATVTTRMLLRRRAN